MSSADEAKASQAPLQKAQETVESEFGFRGGEGRFRRLVG